jgi:hypothetical protein
VRGLFGYGPAFSNVTVRGNQFRASDTAVVDLSDYVNADYSFSGNSYSSQRPALQWFRINGWAGRDLAAWTAFSGEPGAATASYVDPATAPDVEGYQASIGDVPTLDGFLAKARSRSREIWCDHYTAASVIAYLRAQLGLPPL